MYKPIIEQEKISFSNLLFFTKINFRRLLLISFSACLLFSLYFLFKPAKYSSKVSFYTNYTESISPNFLNSVFGATTGPASPSLKF